MAANQRRFHQNLLADDLERIAGDRERRLPGDEILSASGGNRRYIRHGADALRSQFQDRIPDHIIRLRLLWQGHDDSTRANDAGLLAGDLGYGVAEKLLMVE